MITFSRAGEDNKSFKVTDIEQTFAGFAGADYDLQVRKPSNAACLLHSHASALESHKVGRQAHGGISNS